MGALIGQNVPTPGLSFPLGVASHFMLDLIPHGDSKLYHKYKAGNSVTKSIIYTSIDSIVAIGIFIFLLETAPYTSRAAMIAGVIGAILPDFLVALGEGIKLRTLLWFQRQHILIHDAIVSRLGDLPFRTGILIQITFLFIMVWIVKH